MKWLILLYIVAINGLVIGYAHKLDQAKAALEECENKNKVVHILPVSE